MSIRRSAAVGLSVLLTAVLAVAAGCGRRPDTRTHPGPALVSYAPLRHPFQHATLYLDRDTAAARYQAEHSAGWLAAITSRPQARWLNGPPDLAAVPEIAATARRRGALPVFVVYYLPNRGCAGYAEGAPTPAAYQEFVERLVAALGATRSALVLEPDATAADCFDRQRADLLATATRRLAGAGHAVYIDAGHSRWRSTGEMAERLISAGIAGAEGFAVNVANRQTTDDAYRWGQELSDLIGGREFVIDTSRNGMGPPPDDPNRDDEWCNPQRQALGTPPTTSTGRSGLAALLWVKAPGESDGRCGGETTYLFSPNQARTLIMNAEWLPPAERAAARAAAPPPTG